MGKAVGGVPAAASLSDAPGEDGVGAWLARQRRLRGISLEELSQLTRIPQRSLERLESGAFDGPPDGFARGFVRTVAAAIGLDPDDAVGRMLREPEDGGRRRAPSLRRVALAGLVLLSVVGLGAAAVRLARRPPAAEGPAPAELPVRRDYVRALAAEQGLLPPPGSARSE